MTRKHLNSKYIQKTNEVKSLENDSYDNNNKLNTSI